MPNQVAGSKIERRLQKLEASLTDNSKLVPYTRKWLLYWTGQMGKYMTGELTRETLPGLIPLEAFRAVLKPAMQERWILRLPGSFEERTAAIRKRTQHRSAATSPRLTEGLCLALADWSAELRILQRGSGGRHTRREVPAKVGPAAPIA